MLMLRHLGGVIVATMATLSGASAAEAGRCRGDKIIQNCVMYHPDGTPYVTNPSVPAAYTTCQPLRVPCDYPENLLDALSRIFGPER